jgi:ABC-type lipoprotein release transport system permease subunit
VQAEKDNGPLVLEGIRKMEFKVSGRLPPASGMIAHDIVILNEEDARLLLGLPEGHASDLALDVFHEEEEDAILPDLAKAFPWPVRITTRSETIGRYAGGTARRGGIALVLAVPAILAGVLLVAGTVRDRVGRRREVGLLKAMGWTTGDLVRLNLIRSVAVGLPATALGMFCAYLLVLWPGVRWPCALLFGWQGRPPMLHLSPSGAFLILIEVGALVFVPWLAANLWPSIGGAAADPQELIQGGELLA